MSNENTKPSHTREEQEKGTATLEAGLRYVKHYNIQRMIDDLAHFCTTDASVLRRHLERYMERTWYNTYTPEQLRTYEEDYIRWTNPATQSA